MIKMVCSDLDTLLQYGKKPLRAKFRSEIRALHDRGICSARPAGDGIPACANCSPCGQTIASTQCGNGAVVCRGGRSNRQNADARALAEEIAWDFWNSTEDLGEVMLSGENMSYLMERGHGVVDRIKFVATIIRSSQTPPRSRRISSRCPSVWWTAWSRLWSALCPSVAAGQLRRGGTQIGSIPPWPTRGLAYRASAVCWALTRRM